MKTREFIAELKRRDPAGDAEVIMTPLFFGAPGSAPWVEVVPGMTLTSGSPVRVDQVTLWCDMGYGRDRVVAWISARLEAGEHLEDLLADGE